MPKRERYVPTCFFSLDFASHYNYYSVVHVLTKQPRIKKDLDRNDKQKKKRYEIENGIAKSRAEASGFDEDQKKYLAVSAEEVDDSKGQSAKRSSFSGLKKRLSSRRKKDQVDAE